MHRQKSKAFLLKRLSILTTAEVEAVKVVLSPLDTSSTFYKNASFCISTYICKENLQGVEN